MAYYIMNCGLLLASLIVIALFLLICTCKSNFNSSPYDIVIIVPCRKRKSYWEVFKKEMRKYLKKQGLKPLFIIAQNTESKFNRGKSLNLGLKFVSKHFPKNTTIVTQDVDIIPRHNVDYSNPNEPMSTWFLNAGGLKGKLSDFIKINGYSNEYFGWGEEDSDMYDRFRAMGVNYIWWPGKHTDAGMLDLELDQPENKENQYKKWYFKDTGAKAYPHFYSQRNKKYGISKRISPYKRDWHTNKGFNDNVNIRKKINSLAPPTKRDIYNRDGMNQIDLDKASVEQLEKDVIEIIL